MSFGNNSNTLTYGNLTANGSFGNLSSNIFSSAPSILDFLIVGGGGGGGGSASPQDGYASGSGGGGGGGVLRSFNTSSGDITTPINASTAGVLTIVVGAGGALAANGGNSSITGSGVSISVNGGNAGGSGNSVGSASNVTGGTSGSPSIHGGSNGGSGAFTRTLCVGSSAPFSQGGQGTAVAGGYKGGGGGGAGANASGQSGGAGLLSSITGSALNYGGGGKAYSGGYGSTAAHGYGTGGRGSWSDNEYSLYIYQSTSSCTTTNYGVVQYNQPTAAYAGGVYLRWSGNVPSSNTGGTLSTVGGDNLLSYTTAGTYTLIF